MSLIHEALKRAEVDKLRRSPYFNNLTVIPPAEDEVPPPPRPVAPPAPPRAGVPTLKILAVAMVVTAGVGGWFLWKQYHGRLGLPAAVVAQDAPATPALATAEHKPSADPPAAAGRTPPPPPVPPAEVVPVAPPVPAPTAAAVPVPKAATPQAVATIVDVTPPPPAAETAVALAGRADPVPTVDPEPAGAADQPAEASPKAATAEKPPAAPAAGRTTATRSAGAKARPGPAATVASSHSSGSKQPAAKADASRYRLSAIGRTDEGAVALINESVVQVGQTVLDAKVVKIGPNYVELETDGTRFTIRL